MPNDQQSTGEPGGCSARPACSALPDPTVKNPIYAEYYSHMKGDCYKVKLPWTTYREHVLVLCLVTDGIEEARRLAKRELTKHMKAALAQEVPNVQDNRPAQGSSRRSG